MESSFGSSQDGVADTRSRAGSPASRSARLRGVVVAFAALLACSSEDPRPASVAPCGARELRCGGACVDVWSDPNRCGGCDAACAAGTACVAGHCARPPHRVALGISHACALRGDGGAVCWGRFDERLGAGTTDCVADPITGFLQCSTRGPGPVVGLTDAVEIASWADFTCARRAGGRVVCWGANTSGQLGSSSAPQEMVATPVTVSGLVDTAQIVVGRAHACALHADATVSCWGDGARGQIGEGARVSRVSPIAVRGLRDVVELSAGRDHTCARRRDGTVACWGANAAQQFATFLADDQLTPVDVYDRATEVATGDTFTCVRLLDGRLLASSTLGNVQLADLAGVRDLTGRDGDYTLCGLRDGSVLCLGADPSSRFAHTVEAPRRAVVIPDVDDAVEVALGPGRACARRRDGAVWCWGAAVVFDGVERLRIPPTVVPGLDDVEEVLAGESTTCARRRGGGLACWGYLRDLLEADRNGEYGHVTALEGLPASARLAARGGDRYCALSNGEVWCWGTELNVDGNLGPMHEPITPHRVTAFETSTSVAITAGRIECAARPDGTLWCRGAFPPGGDAGVARQVAELGDVTAVAMNGINLGGIVLRRGGTVVRFGVGRPLSVVEGYDRITAIAAGTNFECGLREDGRVLCSGGIGAREPVQGTTHGNSASLVTGLPASTAVAAGGALACALTREGAVWCWGDSTPDSMLPSDPPKYLAAAAIDGVTGAVGVSVGDDHACAWRADGTVLCWGSNSQGRSGVIIPTNGAPWRLAGVP